MAEHDFAREARAANAIAAKLRGLAPPPVAKSRKAQGVTPRQAEVLAFLHAFFEENDQLPPVSAVAKHFGLGHGAAHWHLEQLLHHGAIERNTVGRYRFARHGATKATTP